MDRIKVNKPFTYYLNGYEKQDFAIGTHNVSRDCAAFAVSKGYAAIEAKGGGGGNAGTNQSGNGKKPPAR